MLCCSQVRLESVLFVTVVLALKLRTIYLGIETRSTWNSSLRAKEGPAQDANVLRVTTMFLISILGWNGEFLLGYIWN